MAGGMESPVIAKPEETGFMRWSMFNPRSVNRFAWADSEKADLMVHVVRIMSAIYFFSTMTASNVYFDQTFIRTISYLTNWGVWALTAYCGISGIGGLIGHMGWAKGCCANVLRDGWTGYRKTVVLMFELIFSFEVCITIMYWLMLYDYGRNTKDVSFYYSFNHHATALIYMLLEMALTTHFVYFRHVVIGLIAAIVYTLWNMIFTFASGWPVYGILDWEGVGSAILVIVTLLLLVMAYAIGHGLSAAKADKMKIKFRAPPSEAAPGVELSGKYTHDAGESKGVIAAAATAPAVEAAEDPVPADGAEA